MEPLWWYRLELEWKSTPNSLQSPSSFHSAKLVATKHYAGICLLKQDDKKRSGRHIFVGFYLFWIWVLFGFSEDFVYSNIEQSRISTSANPLGDYQSDYHLEKEKRTEQKHKV